MRDTCDKGKVVRTTELKDGCDLLVGWIYDAQLNYNDSPIEEYKTEITFKKSTNYSDFINENEYISDFI